MKCNFLKNFFRLFLCSLILFSFSRISSQDIAYYSQTRDVDNPQILVQWAQNHLSQEGTLQENKEGFVYLKVDDDYINKLFPLLNYPKYRKPPYFRRSNSPGAHISVFYRDERNRTGRIQEIGQRFSFKIAGLAIVPPKKQEYIVLQVNSPQLEELRKKYGLEPLLNGHSFHITIAKKNKYKY